MNDVDRTVECGVHGKGTATYLCHHLLTGEALGFHLGFDPDDPDQLYPDAWCDQCNEVLAEEGDWNDRAAAFADIKMVCARCYCDIRERHWKQDDTAIAELMSSSVAYLQAAQTHFTQTYRINEHQRWDCDQESGTLVFSHAGKPIVACDIDFVGTYSETSQTWMWAWANDSLPESIKAQSRRVRQLGEDQGFLKFAAGLWSATEQDGWDMTAVMAKRLGAIGAYRTPHEQGFVFMTIAAARWSDASRSGDDPGAER